MPRLPLELATHLRHVGSTNGVELYRRVVRKTGPPQKNDAFHMGNEIRGLSGKGTLKDFSQTCRFLAFLDQKRKHYLLEIGAAFSREDTGGVLVSHCGRGHRMDSQMEPKLDKSRNKHKIGQSKKQQKKTANKSATVSK